MVCKCQKKNKTGIPVVFCVRDTLKKKQGTLEKYLTYLDQNLY